MSTVFSVIERCKECGFKRKGANHNDGEHHKKGQKGKCHIGPTRRSGKSK